MLSPAQATTFSDDIVTAFKGRDISDALMVLLYAVERLAGMYKSPNDAYNAINTFRQALKIDLPNIEAEIRKRNAEPDKRAIN